jgi:uncharacterized protein involved in exopolysaccharide biosynthesis
MSMVDKTGSSEKQLTIKELFVKIGTIMIYIRTKWLYLILGGMLGALIGLSISLFKKPLYTAESTFVLEEGSKFGGMLSQYSSLASLAGVDINSASGLFEGENILELYKSRSMIEKTLLSPIVINNKKQLLIDRYIDFHNLRKKWLKDNINNINFNGDPGKFNRQQDSIITDLVNTFNKKYLTVNKLDKKLSIIVVKFSCTDELFARDFTNKLVETVNEFYVQTKAKKSTQNVQLLQRQADSVKAILNSSIGDVASAMDAAPNANPQLLKLRVPSQRKQIDVQASSAVYAEIVKNLEVAKITMRQDVPLIQIIDKPVIPLENDHIKPLKGLIIGFLLGIFVITSVFFIRQFLFT